MTDSPPRPLIMVHYSRLIDRTDFSLFGELAKSWPQDRIGATTAARELETLLGAAVTILASMPNGETNAAKAIDAYVADVWPARQALGLDAGQAARLAVNAGIRNRVSSSTNLSLDEASARDAATGRRNAGGAASPRQTAGGATPAPTSTQRSGAGAAAGKAGTGAAAGGGGAAGARTGAGATGNAGGASGGGEDELHHPPEKPRTSNNRVFGDEFVRFSEVCDILVNRRKKRDVTIIMLGLETAGKTFFVRRLKLSLGGSYVLEGYNDPINFTGDKVDRTKGVRYYYFKNLKSRKASIHLFDIPGEAFRSLAVGEGQNAGGLNTNSLDPEIRKSTCALLADSQVAIIVEPTLEVLDPQHFSDHGDEFDAIRRREHREDIRGKWNIKTMGEPTEAKILDEANRRILNARQTHVGLVREFPSNFAAVLKKVKTYRARLQPLLKSRQKDAAAFAAEVETLVKTPPKDLPDHRGRLPMAGLHLLSRADEYQRINKLNANSFDRDPGLTMVSLAAKRFEPLELSFDVFGVDFITSEPMVGGPSRSFLGRPGASGFHKLDSHWLIPAARLVRRPWWRKLGSSWAGSPGSAIRMRSLVDRRFARKWKEREK